jgi:DNA-binding transcriptional LysR family regulator
MQFSRDILTPDALYMLQTIGSTGSFAAAARALNLVPSTLSYRVRQIEEALDVLLYDRNSRQAKPTEAGAELLREATRLLGEIDAVANRVKRVATGWESQFTVAVDTIIAKSTVMELCDGFFAQTPPTRLRLRDETLAGTLEALTPGNADLAIGVGPDASAHAGVQTRVLGTLSFVYAVAPHHPLALAPEPLSDATMQMHRAVAVADSVQRGAGLTFGLLHGQDVFTVASMQAKIDAQLRGLGGGNVPLTMAAPYLASGRLVAKRTERAAQQVTVYYAWRAGKGSAQGRALQWWLQQLDSATTRGALLDAQRMG